MQFANCFEIGVGRVYEVLHSAYTHFFPVRRLSTSQLCSEKMSLVIPYDSHVLQIIICHGTTPTLFQFSDLLCICSINNTQSQLFSYSISQFINLYDYEWSTKNNNSHKSVIHNKYWLFTIIQVSYLIYESEL